MEHFSAFILSHDREAIRVIKRVFDEYGVQVKVLTKASEAEEELKRRRIDLAVYDYDLPGVGQLSCLDPATRFRGMVFALADQSKIQQIHGKRIHLMLPKPLTVGLFSKGLRAAYTTMVNDRRTSYRHPIHLSPTSSELVHKGETCLLEKAQIINISRTGLCLSTGTVLPQGGTVHVSFEIPDMHESVTIKGTVMWGGDSGQAGIKFTQVCTGQKQFFDWLDSVSRIQPQADLAPVALRGHTRANWQTTSGPAPLAG